MYKAKELRDQSVEELEISYQETCKRLFDLKHAFKYQKSNEKPHEIKQVRKDIARMLTVLTEKRRAKQDLSRKG